MNKIFYALFVVTSLLTSCQRENHPVPKEPITIFEGDLSRVQGTAEELSFLQTFPREAYQVISVPNIGAFYIDKRHDIIKNVLRGRQAWEKEIVGLINRFTKPGSVAIDIGAHVGSHTLVMSALVGNPGRVIAFEPQKKIYRELVMNLHLNNRKNVSAYRCAVGNAFTQMEMALPVEDNEGGTGFGTGGDKVEMITLDSLKLNNVSVIKIDTENFEYEVLQGAEQTIRRNRPYIILEVMGNKYKPILDRKERVERTIQYLENLGYSVSYIQGSWSNWLASPNK